MHFSFPSLLIAQSHTGSSAPQSMAAITTAAVNAAELAQRQYPAAARKVNREVWSNSELGRIFV